MSIRPTFWFFKWPGFYGLATVVLFLPGLVVQLFQNRYDKAFDTRFGARQTAICRLLTGHATQLLALAAFLVLLHTFYGTPPQSGELPPGDSTKTILLLACFVPLGLGCSIVYGTAAQVSERATPHPPDTTRCSMT